MKIFPLALMFSLCLSFWPAGALQAQEAAPDENLWQLLQASQDYGLFLQVLEAADPIFTAHLEGGWAATTLLAPTDAALEAYLQEAGLSLEDLLKAEGLNSLIAYHLLPGTFGEGALLATAGAYYGTDLPRSVVQITAEDESLLANGVLIESPNAIVGNNGVIHGLGGVLTPPEGLVWAYGDEDLADNFQTLADDPRFSLFAQLIQAAEREVPLRVMPYLIFAPSNETIEALLAEQGIRFEDLLDNPSTLAPLTIYHLYGNTLTPEDLAALASSDEEGVLLGSRLDGTMARLTIDAEGELYVDGLPLDETPIFTQNGVIYVIEGVLFPG
jgi:uncharacterized surface protein with fasciclin (FAS1) repeats